MRETGSQYLQAKDLPKEQVLKRMKCIVDMVTLENIDLLVVQLESGITTPETLECVVTMIFYKAISQPILCPIYAQLCADLNEKLPPFPPGSDGERTVTLRRILLNKCQEAFEGNDNMWSQIRKLIDPEQEMDHRDKERIVKLWYLGNIQLICQLWKEKLMPDRIIHHIIRELLGLDMKACPFEANVEAICLLFNTIGAQLDENPMSRHVIDAYFNELKDLTANPLLTSRLTFMAWNIIDLRTNNWPIQREKTQIVQFDDATYRAMQSLQKALTDLKEYKEDHSGRHHVPSDSNAFYFALTYTVLLCILCFILGIIIAKRL